MVKVLYIGHYREASGWGQAARDYILAMDSVGIDVVPRAVKLGLPTPPLSKRLLELEDKSSQGCDICIQHVLPHYMDYNGRFKKNIALFATETDSFKFSTWPEKINTMDEAWVINEQMVEACRNSGVKVPITVIPHATDVTKFEKLCPPLDVPPLNDEFVFYFIGEATPRKNLPALIKAFHLEFSPNEPVSLLIKSNKYGSSPEDTAKHISDLCNKIKMGLKLYKDLEEYKKEIIITNYMPEEVLAQLHNTCHCFVMPSRGEAWCIPAMDALGWGNPVIATGIGGLNEFVDSSCGDDISYHLEPVTGLTDTFQDIGTGRENWAEINIDQLRMSMREMYKNKEHYQDRRDNALKVPYNFTYERIGQIIKNAINMKHNQTYVPELP